MQEDSHRQGAADQGMGTEMSELYRALAHIKDDYTGHTISYQQAVHAMQQAKALYQPDWWQDQVMVLSLQLEHHRRVIRGLWVLLAFLCVILMLVVLSLVVVALRVQ
jgi:hypothetical protein